MKKIIIELIRLVLLGLKWLNFVIFFISKMFFFLFKNFFWNKLDFFAFSREIGLNRLKRVVVVVADVALHAINN